MITLERLSENNIGYVVDLVMQNKELLDLPPTTEPVKYKAFIENKNKTLPVWYVGSIDGMNIGAIGVAGIRGGLAFVQTVIEKEYRGRGLFSELFSIMEFNASVLNYIPAWGLTTLPTNLAMQRAAVNLGFFFAGTIDSPNNTGNKLYLYEMQNHLKFLYNKNHI